MIKQKDFWNIMCIELGFKFYTGVPVPEHELLFSSMNSDFMHYVPTSSEPIALGIASGASMLGKKASIFMSTKAFDIIKYQFINFNLTYDIPVLFIVEAEHNPLQLKQFVASTKQDLIDLNKFMFNDENNLSSAILIFKGEGKFNA